MPKKKYIFYVVLTLLILLLFFYIHISNKANGLVVYIISIEITGKIW